MPAVSFGVVIERASGAVVRIMNPDYEWELDRHFVGSGEFMLRVPKNEWGVGVNDMTLDQVYRVIAALGK